MRRFWWRIRVAYWLKRLSICTLYDAWDYSGSFDPEEYAADDNMTPRDAVVSDMTYWER